MASGRRELVKWLLDGRPSQVNATNHEGRTPLHLAAATDNADLCRLLLDRGAEVSPVARSSKNEPLTPLDCATSRGHRSTAKYLQMHGGLPASKLSNTQIVIDGAPITSLPTRRVTSTKIDVRDRIRIEKREVVELSSPVHERRRIKDKNDSESTNESSSDSRRASRKISENKYSDKHRERKKKLMHLQKSFSDGYDSEFEDSKGNSYDKKHRKSKKNRSRSEPSRRHKTSANHRRRRYASDTESSDSESYSEKKKSKRQRKKSKRKYTSSSESSSSESTERRSTKRKGKKTSIHIENNDKKQSVNIVKFKNADLPSRPQSIENNENIGAVIDTAVTAIQIEPEVDEPQTEKSRAQSETETDTLSVKTNMVVTEAQIHMERQSSHQGNSEITVTLDSSNNVSIETANVSVTHTNLTEETKPEPERPLDEHEILPEAKAPSTTVAGDATVSDGQVPEENLARDGMEKEISDSKKIETPESKKTDKFSSETLKDNDEESKTQSPSEKKDDLMSPTNKDEETSRHEKENAVEKQESGSNKSEQARLTSESASKSPSPSVEATRKRSFQVLSGPDETLDQSKNFSDMKTSLDATSLEKTESQEKSLSPVVSFANKDEVFGSKDSEKQCDHLMGEEVHHGGTAQGIEPVEEHKDSSESHMSSEDKKKEYAISTTGSSAENIEKELLTAVDPNLSSEDRAVQQVIVENVSGDFDVNLPLSQSTPKRTRKTSQNSQGSSRKSSIYETESYKVLSEIASGEVTTGILKKPTKTDDGSLEDEQETFTESRLTKDGSYGRVPSVSDNELYSFTEVNGRRKRFRKKGRTKSRITIRSKSENSERGYESSGLMDSGFEPSPRALQRQINSPRLVAYYQQRNASGRYSGKSDSRIPIRKPGDKYAVDMKSVTQRIQTNMRR